MPGQLLGFKTPSPEIPRTKKKPIKYQPRPVITLFVCVCVFPGFSLSLRGGLAQPLESGLTAAGMRKPKLGNILETPTPTTCLKSTAVHLSFVRQYAPHLYRRDFPASKLRRKGNPAIRLPFVLQYAPNLYSSTFGKILGVGVTGTFLTNLQTCRGEWWEERRDCWGGGLPGAVLLFSFPSTVPSM